MALSLSQTLPSGVVVTYWSISSFHFNAVAQTAAINLDGYLFNASKSSGNSPVTSITILAPVDVTKTLPNVTILDALYQHIMLDPFFASATIVADGT